MIQSTDASARLLANPNHHLIVQCFSDAMIHRVIMDCEVKGGVFPESD
jgi:hypothetical protein